jgi:superfamily II DNA or RNA helicase
LKQSFEAITLSGDDSEKSRKEKWKILGAGNYQVLITTGQFFGEGTDLQNANCLFLVYPFSFEGKLVQYIGRVQRSEIAPTIYDYRDLKIDYLNKLFLKRNTYYRKIEKQISLFDEPIEEPIFTNNLIKIEKSIKVLLEDLQFNFGTISFIYEVPELKFKLEFTIENQSIRPEFDVLKPYFTKVLNTKFVNVAISAEIENKQLVSQLAFSEDIEKINREFIEGVKFRFISKFIGDKNFNKNLENAQNFEEIQKGISQIYSDDKALLDDILKNKSYKHSPQLRFLANRHEGSILKIRFVLIPFSFVFLICGEQQYHIILETLDTEEATYLWHINKNEMSFKSKIIEIDSQLNLIRNKGRQAFLETEPLDFSRITHDYSDDRKGFIVWKDLLEEKLV